MNENQICFKITDPTKSRAFGDSYDPRNIYHNHKDELEEYLLISNVDSCYNGSFYIYATVTK